jgi:hypothetical protein
MKSYLEKGLLAAGFAASVALAGVISSSCVGPEEVGKAANENVLTAEQCIDDNSAAGVVERDLDKVTITQDMCKEVVERTPGGSPGERAAAVGNMTQELRIIENSMEDASQGDVDGDGRVDGMDGKVIASASFAASRAARQTISRASEQGGTDGGVSTGLDARPVAYLAQRQATSVTAQASSPASTTEPTAESTYESTHESTYESTTGATSSASASASAGGADQAGGSLRERAQDNASVAARNAGAGLKAAEGGGQCAATVKLIDATLKVTRGHMGFKAPANELGWNEHDEARLVVAPDALRSIAQVKREVEQAEEAGETEAGCLRLGNQMEPEITSDDGLDITWYDNRRQDVSAESSTTWRWDIGASERGDHPLFVIVTAYVFPEYVEPESGTPEGITRRIEQPLYEGNVLVGATRWQIFTDFLSNQWQVLVPVFLTLLTAIVIPLVVFWWKRRNRPHGPGGVSDRTPRDDRWM